MTIHGKPLKTRTVSAGRQRTEWQDNMPFVLYSFDGITIEYWNLALYKRYIKEKQHMGIGIHWTRYI